MRLLAASAALLLSNPHRASAVLHAEGTKEERHTEIIQPTWGVQVVKMIYAYAAPATPAGKDDDGAYSPEALKEACLQAHNTILKDKKCKR
jgi:hypothetical protein